MRFKAFLSWRLSLWLNRTSLLWCKLLAINIKEINQRIESDLFNAFIFADFGAVATAWELQRCHRPGNPDEFRNTGRWSLLDPWLSQVISEHRHYSIQVVSGESSTKLQRAKGSLLGKLLMDGLLNNIKLLQHVFADEWYVGRVPNLFTDSLEMIHSFQWQTWEILSVPL